MRMNSTPGTSRSGGQPRSHARPVAADRPLRWRWRLRQAAVALVLVGSTVFTGPTPSASAAITAPDPVRVLVATPDASVSNDADRILGARLAVEYAGAVPARDVESLVRRVSRRLRVEGSPSERLLGTCEAICRRALTDYLARGVVLPVG